MGIIDSLEMFTLLKEKKEIRFASFNQLQDFILKSRFCVNRQSRAVKTPQEYNAAYRLPEKVRRVRTYL